MMPLRCADCGSDDWFGGEPGTAATVSESTDILIDRGAPTRCWCLPCWQERFARRWRGQTDLFGVAA